MTKLAVMKHLRKNIALARVLIALFLVALFAPDGMAASTSEPAGDSINAIVICTTTGLKRITPKGEIVPMDEHDQSRLSEHCETCFLSGMAGNVDRNFAKIIVLSRIVKDKAHPISSKLASPIWTNTCLGARAPPV